MPPAPQHPRQPAIGVPAGPVPDSAGAAVTPAATAGIRPASAAPHPTGAAVPNAVLLIVTALLAFQPTATDVYLPSLPSIAVHFGVAPVGVQSTLSVFLIAFAVAQLVAGPLSDRFGRRPVIVGGQLAFIAGSLASALAPSLETLVAARALQALGTCCTVVCARAMVRDLFAPDVGARVLARALSWMVLVPLFGPTIGGLLQQAFGWRSCFLAMAAFGVAALVATLRLGHETHHARDPDALSPRTLAAAALGILRSRVFLSWLALASCSYAGLFAYISGSSFVLIGLLGLSPYAFGMSFGLISLGYLVGALWVRRRIVVTGLRDAPAIGAVLACGSGLAMGALALADVRHPAAVVLPQFVFMVAHGFNQPCSTSGAVAPFPRTAGTAAALLGSLMHVGAALVGWMIGASQDGTTRPLAFAVAAAGVGAALAWSLAVRRLDEARPA